MDPVSVLTSCTCLITTPWHWSWSAQPSPTQCPHWPGADRTLTLVSGHLSWRRAWHLVTLSPRECGLSTDRYHTLSHVTTLWTSNIGSKWHQSGKCSVNVPMDLREMHVGIEIKCYIPILHQLNADDCHF